MHARFLLSSAMAAITAVLFSATPLADAATVSLGLISKQLAQGAPAGEWELWAWTSSGDNDGISAFNIEIDGDEFRGTHDEPLVATGTGILGFTIGGIQISSYANYTALFAGQNSTNPRSVYYGVGSPDIPARIPLPEPILGPLSRQTDWWLNPAFTSSPSPPDHFVAGTAPFDVPLASVLLAHGTTTNYSTLGYGASTNVNVWEFGEAAINGVDAEEADVLLLLDRVRVVPEPASAVLFCVLLLPLLFRMIRENAERRDPNRISTVFRHCLAV